MPGEVEVFPEILEISRLFRNNGQNKYVEGKNLKCPADSFLKELTAKSYFATLLPDESEKKTIHLSPGS